MPAAGAADQHAYWRASKDTISFAASNRPDAPARAPGPVCAPAHSLALNLVDIGQLDGDDWQRAASSAAERLRRDGYVLVQLNSADAAAVQLALAYTAVNLRQHLTGEAVAAKVLVNLRPGQMRPETRNGAALTQAAAVFEKIIRDVLALLLRGNGLRSDAFNGILDDLKLASGTTSSSVLHALYYRGPTADSASPVVAAEAHEDESVLTAIAADSADGLRVGRNPGSQLVSLQPDQVAVLAGFTLAYATGGMMKASQHSVSVTQPRTALAFKLKANPSCEINLVRQLSSAGFASPRNGPLNFGQPILAERLSVIFQHEHCSINAQTGPVKVLLPDALLAPPHTNGAKRKLNSEDAQHHGVGDARDAKELYFTVWAQDGRALEFRAKPHTTMGKIMAALHNKGLDMVRHQLVFDGVRCNASQRLDDMGLVNGDIIELIAEQVGD